MKTEMQREYEQLCRIDENPGVQGLAQLGRNAINRVSRLESQLARADARIAELEHAVVIRDTEIARLETDLELARRDVARWRAEVAMLCGYDSTVEMDAATGER